MQGAHTGRDIWTSCRANGGRTGVEIKEKHIEVYKKGIRNIWEKYRKYIRNIQEIYKKHIRIF